MQIAREVVEQAIGERMDGSPLPEKKPASPKAIAGRIGGNKGGKARAAALTAEERVRIARKAAMSRWKQTKKSAPRKSSRPQAPSEPQTAQLRD